MAIEILDAVVDARGWRGWLGKLPPGLRDIYFEPDYAALHRFHEGTRARLFAYEDAGQRWLYPFLLRPIERIGEHALAEKWFDIETPYGYGGPLASTQDAEFLASAQRAFTEWCLETKVVAEFVRLHPLLRNERWVDPLMEVVYDRETVSLNLKGFDALGVDELPFDKMTRYMLRRAAGPGMSIEACPAEEYFGEFVRLYRLTMERLDADDYYYFSEDYFAGLRRLICDAGWLLAVKQDGECVAAALFLKGQRWLHYHLSASDPERRVPGATNALIYRAALLGSREGFEVLHLGGGITQATDDSLLKFKRKMGTDAHAFYTGRRIHQPRVYALLREMWANAYPSLVQRYGRRLLCYRSAT
ncbi:MAG TPA: GNAT family N-acetyltransferase [Pyrinomonadaceae bacterium]|jgi:hypothetical protein|nr:GNAT family N-acetyltransferase [Pyrinomonadaceae bacterium]